MNRKQVIRIHENQLKQIVKEAVKQTLKEGYNEFGSINELENLLAEFVNIQCKIEEWFPHGNIESIKFNKLANKAAGFIQGIINNHDINSRS